MTIRLLLAMFALAAAGCTMNDSSTTRPVTLRDRQDAALKNPMGYSPSMDHPDISGGGIDNLDRSALRRDLNSVLNP